MNSGVPFLPFSDPGRGSASDPNICSYNQRIQTLAETHSSSFPALPFLFHLSAFFYSLLLVMCDHWSWVNLSLA